MGDTYEIGWGTMNTVLILVNLVTLLGVVLPLNARSRFSQSIKNDNKQVHESLDVYELAEQQAAEKKLHELESKQEVIENKLVEEKSSASQNKTSVHSLESIIDPLIPSCPELITPSLQELVHEAKVALERLHGDVDMEKGHLQEKTEIQIDSMKNKIERDIQKLKHDAEIRAQNLKKELEEESVRLSHAAAQKALEIVSKAELDAVKLRLQARQEALQKKFADSGIDVAEYSEDTENEEKNEHTQTHVDDKQDQAKEEVQHKQLVETDLYRLKTTQPEGYDKHPVTTEWKNMVAQEFYKDMTFLKEIIVNGETSEVERQDYLNRFKDQNKWFDVTLSSTRHFEDHSYEEIMQKKNELRLLINAQTNADTYFATLSKNLTLSEDEQKKLRLMMLYDLYGCLEKNSQIEPSEIQRLVNKIVDEYSLNFRTMNAQFSDVEIKPDFTTAPVVSPQVKNLEEKLDKTKKRLKLTKNKKKQLKNDATQKLQEKAAAYVELQINLGALQEELNHTKESLRKAHAKASREHIRKEKLLKQLKACEEENLSLVVLHETSNDYNEKIKHDCHKKHIKLKAALEHATLQAQKHEKKALMLVDEVDAVRKKLIQAKIDLKKTKEKA